MNFFYNKVAGVVLSTALGVMALGIIAEGIYEPAEPEKPGFVIAVAEGGEEAAPAGDEKATVAPIADRLQTADAAKGKETAGKCAGCHNFEKGQPNKVGPTLWGVVGGPIILLPNFGYSDAFKAKGAEGFTWTYENLDTFLANPKADIPGTAMNFPGLKKPDDRANVIAFLRTLSDSPLPLPPPSATAAAPAEGAAPAEKPAEAAPAEKPAEAAPAEKPADAAPAEKPPEAAPAEKPAETPAVPADSAAPAATDAAPAQPAPAQ